MSDGLRRILNTVERWFDRAALTEIQTFQRPGEQGNQWLTARQALEESRVVARRVDKRACLMLMVAPEGCVRSDGRSNRWEFFWDLPARRAKMVCNWHLPWSEQRDDYDKAIMDVSITPFPAPDSLQRQLADQGKLLHRQLIGLWNQEHRRHPPLPDRFEDSDHVIARWTGQGLDLAKSAIVLKAEYLVSRGPTWIAECREQRYESPMLE